MELIDRIPGDEPIRMYWHGDWQDLCRGPHLQHTGQLPADADRGGITLNRDGGPDLVVVGNHNPVGRVFDPVEV